MQEDGLSANIKLFCNIVDINRLLGGELSCGTDYHKKDQCGWRDSNPHASRRQILSLVRLPISSHPLFLFI